MRFILCLLGALAIQTAGLGPAHGAASAAEEMPGVAPDAVGVGADLDGDGDPDEVHIRLEVVEVEEEVYPGEVVTFWVFAPEGRGMVAAARAPSPTIRVEEGDRVRITLANTHYFPHTIHLHGTIHDHAMDGVPDVTQPAVAPGESFTYEFVARNPGTHFYHCHVQPDVHVLMGLVGMLIIEPDRPDNRFAHLIPGAGRIQDLAKAAMEHYDREYSLVYLDVDDRLNRIASAFSDPREIERRMHREYDSTQRRPNLFLLNGRAFPYTLRDTPIRVAPDERVKLRVLNAGARTIRLHTHGHHPTLTHTDGYPVPEGGRITRDVFTIGPAQRLDLELSTTADGHHASGPGVWLMHDHTEPAVTNKGIGPGGDITTIVYDGFEEDDGLPRVATDLDRFFDPAYYRGEVPVFDPGIFHTSRAEYEYGWPEGEPAGGALDYPVRAPPRRAPAAAHLLDDHRIVADSCAAPRGFRRVHVRGGTELGRAGEVFAFSPREIRVGRCEEVEVVFENLDAVRHALMIPGLNPMFTLEVRGPGERVARFVTPDADVTLDFHCHVEAHDRMGMHGRLVVGAGGAPAVRVGHPDVHAAAGPEPASELHEGIGTVLTVDRRAGRLVIDHEEIPEFMAPMVMSYQVRPAALLGGLEAGAEVRFTIDADQRAIVDLAPVGNGG